MALAAMLLLSGAAAGAPQAHAPASAPRPKAATAARPGVQALPPALALQRADEALAAKRLEEAARLYATIADRHGSARALLGLARVHSQSGEPRRALEALQRALALAPNSEEVLGANARVALAARAPVVAILALEPLTRIVPSVMEYHYLLGVALMQAGDMASAVPALREALALDPNRALTLVALGLALNSQKLYPEARAPLLRSLEIEPDNLEGLAALAESEEGTDELAAAETHAQRVLGRQGGNAIANLVMGLVRMKQERFAEARDFLERAASADPLSGKAHYQLSLASARLGDAAGQARHYGRYRAVQRELEERLVELRTATGTQLGGMGR
jgi:tetratricopeptide (TPR) repeat protein